jgi:hypothetical protein
MRVLHENHKDTITCDTFDVTMGDAQSVAAGILHAAEIGHPMVVTRGGGDALSLDVFNSEAVLRAVHYAAKLTPVILAVAHAQDTFLAEQVCTKACATPSEAGRLILALNSTWASPVGQNRARTMQHYFGKQPLLQPYAEHHTMPPQRKHKQTYQWRALALLVFLYGLWIVSGAIKWQILSFAQGFTGSVPSKKVPVKTVPSKR